jgi:putative FmdB family regulatory protein
MPIYEYKCLTCGFQCEEFQHMQAAELTECPECKRVSYQKIPSLPGSTMKEYQKPIEMHSIGLGQPDEIAAFKDRNPGATCSSDPADPLYGVPIAHHFHEKKTILKTEGYVDKKGYS